MAWSALHHLGAGPAPQKELFQTSMLRSNGTATHCFWSDDGGWLQAAIFGAVGRQPPDHDTADSELEGAVVVPESETIASSSQVRNLIMLCSTNMCNNAAALQMSSA